MLTIIHGDNIVFSRNELVNIKKNDINQEVLTLDGKNLNLTELTQAVSARSLLGNSKLIVIEKLISANPNKKKFINQAVEIIKREAGDSDIVLWDNKELTRAQLSKFGSQITVRLFKVPVVIFKFLDSLNPNNAKTSLLLFHEVIEKENPELVFAMLVNRVRDLIMVSDNVFRDNLAGWQFSKLKAQTKLFTQDQLVNMHNKLLNMDYSIKSGKSPFDYQKNLELFIIEI